jgi:insecticidal toxin complex protein TccC
VDGLNLYGMVMNSPISLIDPNGLMLKNVAKGVLGAGYAGYQLSKAKDTAQNSPGKTSDAITPQGFKTPGETQANQWLDKSRQHTIKPEDKIAGSFTGRLTAAFHLAQGKLPGAEAVAKGAELAAEAAQFAAHSDVSQIEKTTLAKSAAVDSYNNLGNIVTATRKAVHTGAVVATLPAQKQAELQDELQRRNSETKDGLKTSLATGVAVTGALDMGATLAPPGPIKLGLIGASYAWKATGFLHTGEELSKIAEQHKDLASNEFGKNLSAQVGAINQQKRTELMDQVRRLGPGSANR